MKFTKEWCLKMAQLEGDTEIGAGVTMTNIKNWLVEETDQKGETLFSQEYTDHAEALVMYNSLKENNKDTFVAIHKSEKKLLLD